jgi:hypothetical protein
MVEELRPWIKGFVGKEYSFLESPDQEELEQDGCLSLLLAVRKLNQKPDRFPTKEEYVLYVKAMVRNAVRDCVLKLKSRFNISLFKLRRHLREKDTSLNEYMATIGEDYGYIANKTQSLEDVFAQESREQLLGLLSPARKGCKGMTIPECRVLLKEVIERLTPDMRQAIMDKNNE